MIRANAQTGNSLDYKHKQQSKNLPIQWDQGIRVNVHLIIPINLLCNLDINHIQCIFWCSRILFVKKMKTSDYSSTCRSHCVRTLTKHKLIPVPIKIVAAIVGARYWSKFLVRQCFQFKIKCLQYTLCVPQKQPSVKDQWLSISPHSHQRHQE